MSFYINRPIIMLFSQTGSECNEIIRHYGQWPEALVNHLNPRLNLVPNLKNTPSIRQYTISSHPTVQEYESIFSKFTNPLITLHGYLRVIPPEICRKYDIYNLHPADLRTNPELKGLDVQKLVINNPNYPSIGVTIHKCEPELDSGQIILTKSAINPLKAEDVYNVLKDLAFKAWIEFFDNYNTLDTIKNNMNYKNEILATKILEPQKPLAPTCITEVEKRFPQTTKEFRRLQHHDYELFCRKQLDYGPGNISLGSTLESDEDKRVSQSSIIFRCYDKIQRLLNLVVKNPKTLPTNEPIEDAYADLTNYGIIARIVKNNKWGK